VLQRRLAAARHARARRRNAADTATSRAATAPAAHILGWLCDVGAGIRLDLLQRRLAAARHAGSRRQRAAAAEHAVDAATASAADIERRLCDGRSVRGDGRRNLLQRRLAAAGNGTTVRRIDTTAERAAAQLATADDVVCMSRLSARRRMGVRRQWVAAAGSPGRPLRRDPRSIHCHGRWSVSARRRMGATKHGGRPSIVTVGDTEDRFIGHHVVHS
jgi:hypothetical protein